MKSIYIIMFLLLTAPAFVQAEWYWITIPDNPTVGDFTELNALQYATKGIPKEQLQLVPNTLIETWNKTDKTIICSNERKLSLEKMRIFDANNEIYTKTEHQRFKLDDFITETTSIINQKTISDRAYLIKDLEKSAANCLKQDALKLEGDLKKEIEVKRLLEVSNAVKDCDFDFFLNSMTDTERMKSSSERENCKKKAEHIAETITSKPISETSIKQEIATYITSAIIPTPNLAPPDTGPTESEVVIKDSTEIAYSATATGTREEESLRPSEQSFIETIEEKTTPDKPSFFKKIANFFIKLFSW